MGRGAGRAGAPLLSGTSLEAPGLHFLAPFRRSAHTKQASSEFWIFQGNRPIVSDIARNRSETPMFFSSGLLTSRAVMLPRDHG
jgi:hypothetical protein